MKKIVPILIVLGLVLSGLGAVAINDETSQEQVIKSVTFSEPIIKDNNEYISLELAESTSYSMNTGEPILPQYVEVFTFPRGTKIGNVDVSFSNMQETYLTKAISPAPAPVPKMDGVKITKVEKNVEVYSTNELYPSESWSYELKAGLHDGEQSVIVIVRCSPIRYSPADNKIVTSKNVDIEFNYILPENPLTFQDEKDLVIIAPAEFETALQPLVDHKESYGFVTMFKAVEEIYDEYEGFDDQEDIKLFIYDMKETYNITYAMLVGGRKGQTFQWLLPERLTNNNDGWEAGYASDLYFSDIYKIEENETVFDDWDSNDNNIYAEWSNMIGKSDIMDFVPDVYVGRLACRSVKDVDTVVNKIITYETPCEDCDKEWFDRAFVVSGDTFPPGDGGSSGWYEGEMETQLTATSLEGVGMTVDKLWASLDTLTGITDVEAAFGPGASFVHFAGHGNPMSWSTHPADDTEHIWINGINLRSIVKYRNGEHLPIVVIGGCHNGQFNVTFANFIQGILTHGLDYFNIPSEDNPFLGPFWKKEWGPKDTIWGMVVQNNGGSIGGIAMTALGYGYINEHGTAGLGGWIDPRFFHSYADDGYDILGQAHSETIFDYITIIGNVNSDQIDRKTIEAWVLLGDPSLQIGGYEV